MKILNTIKVSIILVACSMYGLATPFQSVTDQVLKGLHLVARDNCGVDGEQPHLLSGENYRYPESAVPVDSIGSGDPARTVAFGSTVQFRYRGLRPSAWYKLRIDFLSDSADRVQQIKANGQVLYEAMTLPKKKKTTVIHKLESEIYKNGDLLLEFTRVKGPNAVVSTIELWSSEEALLPVLDLRLNAGSFDSIEGRVTDGNNNEAASGAFVRANLMDTSMFLETRTAPTGTFDLDIPETWKKNKDARIEITASNGEAGCRSVHALEEFVLIMPRLTPAPSAVPDLEPFKIDLNGTWRFNPAPADDFWKSDAPAGSWTGIEVPGEWVMQGFEVEKDRAAGYARQFEVPADWEGRRVKLRCDGVYSYCRVFINGIEAGQHDCGFTPFELDVTGLVRYGEENSIALTVLNDSLADRVASGTFYAAHPLGGITRKIYLFAVPEVNIASFHVETHFEDDYRDARLKILLELANETGQSIDDLEARFSLIDPKGQSLGEPGSVRLTDLEAGGSGNHVIDFPVASPMKWDPEHPHLYRLTCTLLRGGNVLESVERRVGFRQVEVRGNQVFVNNRPIKLRGVCRHEAHPLRGRSLTPAEWRRDAELYREANVNYIRTSHYPPAEEFIEICDEMGFFVEEEAPINWVGRDYGGKLEEGVADSHSKFLLGIVRPTLEMVQRDRSHPSVIIWSLGNESHWSPNFECSARHVAKADPTRPRQFTYGERNNAVEKDFCQVGSFHYPGPKGPEKYANHFRPVVFDEYCHLNTYNRRENVADPGVRDAWGRGFETMCHAMYESTGCLGGAIWSGINDIFYLPSGRAIGYGDWGPIDGWRRKKPEYWHMKKSYSPVQVLTKNPDLPEAGEPIMVRIENRHDFTNLKEVRIEWAVAEEAGTVKTDIPPRSEGSLFVRPVNRDLKGKYLSLNFISPRSFVIDTYRLPIGPVVSTEGSTGSQNRFSVNKVKLIQAQDAFTAEGSDFTWVFDRKSGRILEAEIKGRTVLTGGPELMMLPLMNGPCAPDFSATILPLNNTCKAWLCKSVIARQVSDGVEVLVEGVYEEAAGSYTMKVDGSGALTVGYRFSSSIKINPRQIGMVFTLPRAHDTIAWKRIGQWTVYPDNHIGRPAGEAKAFGPEGDGPMDLRMKPGWSWSQDWNALGTNDFRSAKNQILWATLLSDDGTGVRVVSGGTQSVRAFVDGDRVRLLVAGFTTGGGDQFFSSHLASERRPLEVGSALEDTIRLEFEY